MSDSRKTPTDAPDADHRGMLGVWAILAVAFWPVWRWYALRLVDGADEKWGVLALVLVAVLAWARRQIGTPPFALLALTLLAYAAAYAHLPPLGRALLALAAVGLVVRRSCKGPHLALVGLLFLSLPVEATLQHVCGYPLRHVVASCSALLLSGLGVVARGTTLCWAGETILVDAPCSGLRMLWTALLLGLTLCALQSLRAIRTVLVALTSIAAAFAGNVLRATALFFKEAGIVSLPVWTHEGMGLLAFGLVALVIVRAARRRDESRDLPSATTVERGRWGFVAAGILATILPLVAPATVRADVRAFPGWPDEWGGRALVPVPLDAKASAWAAEFPGRLATFVAGEQDVLLRWVSGPTRRLHTSADCYRGLGYRTSPLPARRDARGVVWGCSLARRGTTALRVCEYLTSADGQTFSDPSSWYWSALLGKSKGPYWAVTVAEAAD
jgi:exosortase/archaeosortase family protein